MGASSEYADQIGLHSFVHTMPARIHFAVLYVASFPCSAALEFRRLLRATVGAPLTASNTANISPARLPLGQTLRTVGS